VTPWEEGEGRGNTFRLGAGLHGLYGSRPWTHHMVSLETAATCHEDAVVWLDFGAGHTGTSRIAFFNAGEVPLATYETRPTRGLNAFFVPGDKAHGFQRITVESERPVGRDILFGIQERTRPMAFSFERHRSLSQHFWIKEPFPPPSPAQNYAAPVRQAGRIDVPLPQSCKPLDVIIAFELRPLRPEDRQVEVVIRQAEEELSRKVVPMSRRTWHILDNVAAAGNSAELMITMQPAPKHNNPLLLEQVLIYAYDPHAKESNWDSPMEFSIRARR